MGETRRPEGGQASLGTGVGCLARGQAERGCCGGDRGRGRDGTGTGCEWGALRRERGKG